MVDQGNTRENPPNNRSKTSASNNVQLLQRVVGAVVLLVAALALGPMLFPSKEERGVITQTLEIPDKPKVKTFAIKEPQGQSGQSFEEQQLDLNSTSTDLTEAASGIIQRDSSTITSESSASDSSNSKLADSTSTLGASSSSTVKIPAPEFKPSWLLQIGNFSDSANALSLQAQAAELGFRVYSRTEKQGGKSLTKVLIGPKLDKTRADALKLDVEEKLGIKSFLVEFHPSDRFFDGSR